MTPYISMLRGINVGGQKSIRMADLKMLCERLGFTQVRTYVQSGNVVFDASEPDPARVTAALEAGIAETFGFEVSVFIREARDFQRLLDTNPFLHGRSEDPGKLHVTFLYTSPSPVKAGSLDKPASGRDEFIMGEQELFVFCPDGYGRTKLSNTFFERKLAVPATTRNWNTVSTLLQMANEPS